MRTRMMKLGPALVALAALVAACKGSSSSGPAESSITGTWTATKMEYVSTANPGTSVDLVAQGASVTLNLTGSHDYTLTIRTSGQPDEVYTGTWNASGDVLTMSVAGGNMQFNMSLSGTTLTLYGADADFDFNNDGVDEAAKLAMVLER